MIHWTYARYVLRHKWFVFLACLRMGLFWRGIIHDWTKLLPCEWIPYARYFNGPQPPGYFTARAFYDAWLHHQHWNKHHWQHWVLRNDNGDTQILQMPDVYVREMVADWRGAGRALGAPNTAAWYRKNRAHIRLHYATRMQVERLLGIED